MRLRNVALICLVVLLAAAALAGQKPAPPNKGADRGPAWWGAPPRETPAEMGAVAAVSPTQITLNTAHGQVTFSITNQTKFWVRGKKGSLADVQVGDPCRVVFTPVQGGQAVARRIEIPRPRATGQITAINGNVLTVKKGDVVWTITVPAEAKIRCRRYLGTLDDLRVGYHVSAAGQMNGKDVIAESVEFVPTVYKGSVLEVSGNQITVKTIRQKVVAGAVTDKTTILIRPRVGPNKPGTLADIKPGLPVNIGGHEVAGGPMQLIFVDVLTGI